MKVEILAQTSMRYSVLKYAYNYSADGLDWDTRDADALGEAAGRMCYQSWERKNPATASNSDYLANIIAQGHFSVLEHSSVTFLVRGVSRALLTELSRHRHLSFSVVSQRYVPYGETEPVIPPALVDSVYGVDTIESFYYQAAAMYEKLVDFLVTREGLKHKQAREAARAILPNAAPVDMVVTGNLRAWRDVLGKRWHVAADAEIRQFAGAVLKHLRSVAPNSFQDVPAEPYGTE